VHCLSGGQRQRFYSSRIQFPTKGDLAPYRANDWERLHETGIVWTGYGGLVFSHRGLARRLTQERSVFSVLFLEWLFENASGQFSRRLPGESEPNFPRASFGQKTPCYTASLDEGRVML